MVRFGPRFTHPSSVVPMNFPADVLQKITRHPGKGVSLSAGQQVAVLAAMWAGLSGFLLLVRPGYLFPAFGLLDSWIYTAYQWDLRNQIADFGPTYYGSRLSWILPGAFLHAWLPPVAANLVYKLLVSAVFAAGCAAIVRRALGFAAALLAVALSVLSPQIIVALQTDYIDTAVFVYATVALACITAARDSPRWPAWIFLGGCAYAGMAIANLSSLASLGAGVAAFHLAWLRWDFRRQAGSVCLYAAAAACVCVALGLIHRMVGGEFNFLKPQVDMLAYMKGLKNNPWIPQDPWWFIQATWLWLPGGTLLWGISCSVVHPPLEERARQLVRALTIGLAASLLLAAFLQVRELNATLSFSFYASFHLALALPLLAACWSATTRARPAPSRRMVAAVLAMAALVAAWPQKAVVGWIVQALPMTVTPGAVLLTTAGLLLASAAAVAIVRRRSGDQVARWLRPEILLVGLFLCSLPIDFHDAKVSDRLRERYQSVHAAYRILAREFAPGSYRFWVARKFLKEGNTLASTKLWGFRLLTLSLFPQHEPGNFAAHGEKNFLVVPSAPGQGPQTIAAATEVLRQANYSLADTRTIPVPGAKGTGFDLVCFRIQAMPIDPEDSGTRPAPAEAILDLDFHSTPPYIETLSRNLYGPGAGRCMDTSRGYPVFTRTDPRDHLATPFMNLHARPPGTPRQVYLTATMPAAGDCGGTIQVDDCVTIASVTWTRPGRFAHTITVPPNAKTIRLYLQGGSDQPTPLPTRITLHELLPAMTTGK